MNKPNPGRENARPSFFSRVSLAFNAFFRIVGNPDYAGRIDSLPENKEAEQAKPTAPAAPAEAKPALRILKEASPDAALQLLGMLQRDARRSILPRKTCPPIPMPTSAPPPAWCMKAAARCCANIS